MKILNWKLFLEELVGEKPIESIESYIQGMSMTIQDKLFFLDKIDFDCIVDFGCADGTTLFEIQKRKPNVKLIGYDLDDQMLQLASNKVEGAFLTSKWPEVIEEIKSYKRVVLNLSSVIHEVYSYSHPSAVKVFWEKQVFGDRFNYITIRDMIPSTELAKKEIHLFEEDVIKVKSKSDPYYLDSFEKKWGTIDDDYRTFTHYLLKYRFTDNWEREVNENYLPVSLETLKKKIPSNYSIVYEEDFILPFLKQKVKEDFDVDMTHSTHTKMIIKKND